MNDTECGTSTDTECGTSTDTGCGTSTDTECYIQWSTPPLEGRMVVAILRIPVHQSHPGGELCIMI